MGKIVEPIQSSQILKKHLGGVHTSSSLSSVQRKVVNVLLEHSFDTITEDTEHKISMKDLFEPIGWSTESKVPETFRDSLLELAKTQIQWNVLEQDKKNKWLSSSFLAHVGIKDGFLYYSFSLALRQLFGEPNVYAKLNLDVQKKFKVKYSVIFWELICGDLSSKKVDQVSTGWIPYEKVLALTGLINHCYETRYSAFIERVLAPSMKEINAYSDILVRYELKRTKKQITHICFFGEKKARLPNIVVKDIGLSESRIKKLKELGIAGDDLLKLIKKYSVERLEIALDFLDYSHRTGKDPIRNPVAFFKSTLVEGWVTPTVQSKKDEKGEDEIKDTINLLEEEEECIKIRLFLIDSIGVAQYKSWFFPSTMSIVQKVLQIECKSDFLRNYLNAHFSSNLNNAIQYCDPGLTGFSIVSV